MDVVLAYRDWSSIWIEGEGNINGLPLDSSRVAEYFAFVDLDCSSLWAACFVAQVQIDHLFTILAIRKIDKRIISKLAAILVAIYLDQG